MPDFSVNAQSSIRISGEKVVYFDPFQIVEGEHDADIIFVTHEHFDHFSPEDILKVAKKETVLVVPESMKKAVGAIKGIQDIVFVAPDTYKRSTYSAAGISFSTVRAYNVGKPFHGKESNWVGYIVDINGKAVYVTGDTDANEDNLKVSCDILFVPCGGKYTFDPKEAAAFAASIKPKMAVPTHYGRVVGSDAGGKRFVEELKKIAPGIDTEILL